jgi:uncharacterized protein DUF4397
MRTGVAVGRWVAVLIASLLMLLVGPAASASGDAKVRFVQTVPAPGSLELHATTGGISERIGHPLRFGQTGSYEDLPAGNVKFELREPEGGPMTSAQEQLENRAHYTVVAMRNEQLMVLRDGRGEGGTSRMRVVNSAPELGAVDVNLGDQTIADGLGYGKVSGYTSVGPGAYALSVMNPQDGSTLATRGAVTLTAGTSSTAFVVGTAGEPIDLVVAGDRTAAPRGAPQTGLGGLADGDSPVGLALLAGFLAALAGAAAYVALTARSRRGG